MTRESSAGRRYSHEDLLVRKTEQRFSELANVFGYCFFSPQNEDQLAFPKVTVTVEPKPIKILANQLIHKDHARIYEIVLNQWWMNRPEWELSETLLHSMLHIHQEMVMGGVIGGEKYNHGYHGKRFIETSRELGLYIGTDGSHERPANGQFARLMEKVGIALPAYTIDDLTLIPGTRLRNWWDYDRGLPEGKSTLLRYICECKPPFIIRAGRNNLNATCNNCSQPFTISVPPGR